jgi:hypothetical protein
MARTRGASLIVILRGRISRTWLAVRLSTARSTLPAAAQSATPADAYTAVGSLERPPPDVGCLAPPPTALPHAASPIRVLTAVMASIPRTAAPSGQFCLPTGCGGVRLSRIFSC